MNWDSGDMRAGIVSGDEACSDDQTSCGTGDGNPVTNSLPRNRRCEQTPVIAGVVNVLFVSRVS